MKTVICDECQLPAKLTIRCDCGCPDPLLICAACRQQHYKKGL